MKRLLFLIILFSLTPSYGQIMLNFYEDATLFFKNGDTLKGIAKITFDDRIKFKRGKKSAKEIFDYRDVKNLSLYDFPEKRFKNYTYKIIGGEKPIILEILGSFGSIDLFVIENITSQGKFSTTIRNYYVNKGGDQVVFIGYEKPDLFSKMQYSKENSQFFKDCPEVYKLLQNKKTGKTHTVQDLLEIYQLSCEDF